MNLQPVAEAIGPRGLWCVAYLAMDNAFDVLTFKCRVRADGVDLGATTFAGRLRLGDDTASDAWVSTIGEPSPAVLREVAAWVRRATAP